METKKTVTDEYGVWEVYSEGVKALIEPSQKWLDEHPTPDPEPETPTDSDEITAEEALAILIGGDPA